MNYTQGPPSRYEMNQAVRAVLTRHTIDLTFLNVSCSANLVYLNGRLEKAVEEKELSPMDVNNLFREIERIPAVRGIIAELENWIVSGDAGSWLVVPKKSRPPRQVSSTFGAEYSIEKEEKVADVLAEIAGKKEREEDS